MTTNHLHTNAAGLWINRLLLVNGLVFFAVFLITGGYMYMNFPELYQGREEVRMMYRSNHIYILLSALVNLAMAGNVLLMKGSKLSIAKLGTVLLVLAAPTLFLIAFIVEPPQFLLERPYTVLAIWCSVIGVMGQLLFNALSKYFSAAK